LAADRVAAVASRGLVPRRIECAAARFDAEYGAQAWIPAVRKLGDLLAERGWQGSSLDVVLSSEFVRVSLVSGIWRNLGSQELEGLAHGVVSRLLGERAQDWAIRYCAADRTSLFAAAMEKSLLEALSEAAGAAGARLRTVSPLWSCAINHHRRRLARRSGWVVLAEPRAVSFGLLERGRWRAVRARALDRERGLTAAQLVERECRYLGDETRDIVLIGVDAADADFTGKWNVERLARRHASVMPADCLPAAFAGA
jgi:hypothetical protein